MRKILFIASLFVSVLAVGQTIPEKQFGRFNVLAYGADPTFSTDATSAIQSAINACVAAGGGTVFFPKGHYKISGALQTSISSVNPNCQIYIPLVQKPGDGSQPDSITVSVTLEGEFASSTATEGVASLPRNKNGVILESTLTTGSGTTPAVFGTPWYDAGVTGNRNYIQVRMKNLMVRTATRSGGTDVAGQLSGINFQRLVTFSGENVKVDVSSSLVDIAEPTNETYGVIFPDKNNNALLDFDGFLFVEGYKYGVWVGEHANFNRVIVVGCVNGLYIKGNSDYGVRIGLLNAELNTNNITMDGVCNVVIQHYEGEHYTDDDKWWTHQLDINYTSNTYVDGTGGIYIFLSTIGVSGIGPVWDNSHFHTTTGTPYVVYNGVGKNNDGSSAEYEEFFRAEFTGTASTPIGSYTPDVGSWLSTSGTATLNGSGGMTFTGASAAQVDVESADRTMTMVITTLPSTHTDNFIVAGIRYIDDDNFVRGQIDSDGFGSWTLSIVQSVGGSLTTLSTSSIGSITVPATFTATAHGTAVSVSIDGTTLNGTTSITTGKVLFQNVNNNTVFDRFYIATSEAAETYTLPEATASVLGGVKVGSGLQIEDGVLSVTEASEEDGCITETIEDKTFDNSTGWSLIGGASTTQEIVDFGGTNYAHTVANGNYSLFQKEITIGSASLLRVTVFDANFTGTPIMVLYDGGSTTYYTGSITPTGTDVVFDNIPTTGIGSTVTIAFGSGTGAAATELYVRRILVQSLDCSAPYNPALVIIEDENYTVAAGVTHVVFSELTAGRTLTLPAASSNKNRIIHIKHGGNGAFDITTSASMRESTIVTSTTVGQSSSVTIMSDGTQWWVISTN